MAKLKKEDRKEASIRKKEKNAEQRRMEGEPGEKVREFKGFNLESLPEEALPTKQALYRGAFSYTVNINGADSQLCVNIFSHVCLTAIHNSFIMFQLQLQLAKNARPSKCSARTRPTS